MLSPVLSSVLWIHFDRLSLRVRYRLHPAGCEGKKHLGGTVGCCRNGVVRVWAYIGCRIEKPVDLTGRKGVWRTDTWIECEVIGVRVNGPAAKCTPYGSTVCGWWAKMPILISSLPHPVPVYMVATGYTFSKVSSLLHFLR